VKNGAPSYLELRDLVRDPLSLRVALVQYALEHGVKPAARTYGTSPQTVRLWLRRYRKEGLSGLKAQPKTAKTNHPRTTPKDVEEKIIEFRKRHPHVGQDAIAERLKEQHVSVSGKTVGKILHKYGLLATKPGPKRNYPAQRVSHLHPFEAVQFEVSDFAQSDGYAEAVKKGLIPRYEFSLRDVATGASFMAFAKSLEPHNILCFAQKVLWHLEAFNLKLHVLQIVEGSQWLEHHLDRDLVDFLAAHAITPKFIHSHPSSLPPSTSAFHHIIDLGFSLTTFEAEADLYQKALELERFFNVKRRDPRRKASPFEFAQRKLPELPMAVMEFQPLCLDECDCNAI
jgi:transposase